MFYSLPIYRPPSEKDSLLLQVTIGCSRPQCTFCFFSQQEQKFHIRKLEEIVADIDEAAASIREVTSIFLMAAIPRSLVPTSYAR
jgi:radical SAM superfamily enzyme YgiQ (UPF0313 family)